MGKQEFVRLEFQSVSSESELGSHDQELLEEARSVLQNSYAPYSRFHVAAAIRLSNGKIITGTNQENVAYPSGLCAERVAIFAAKHQFPDAVIDSIAITAESEEFQVDHPITPCGACRQVILEYEINQKSPIRIILKGKKGDVLVVPESRVLLPFYFHESKLKKS